MLSRTWGAGDAAGRLTAHSLFSAAASLIKPSRGCWQSENSRCRFAKWHLGETEKRTGQLRARSGHLDIAEIATFKGSALVCFSASRLGLLPIHALAALLPKVMVGNRTANSLTDSGPAKGRQGRCSIEWASTRLGVSGRPCAHVRSGRPYTGLHWYRSRTSQIDDRIHPEPSRRSCPCLPVSPRCAIPRRRRP